MAKLIEPSKKWGISRGFGNGHNGIDYKYPLNTPVTAAADGVVGFEGWGQNDPWTLSLGGIYVRIQHSDGSWTGYAHLSRTTVNKGQKVKAGQVVGYSGSTGQSTGPHLHFEVIPKVQNWQNGYAARINPASFFAVPPSTSQPKGGDMIDAKDKTQMRAVMRDVKGWNAANVDAGEHDASEAKAWAGKEWELYLAEAVKEGASFRKKRDAALAYYAKKATNDKALADAKAEIERLKKQTPAAPATDSDKKLATLKAALKDVLGI
ncbi:M23 family metallopeptidase [Streptomyces iakyrus]|uniref:M23 family metallopeptidase n=1 Tax=Streptomyces iakyrus TaxID=68219 RepID=UPI0036EB0003